MKKIILAMAIGVALAFVSVYAGAESSTSSSAGSSNSNIATIRHAGPDLNRPVAVRSIDSILISPGTVTIFGRGEVVRIDKKNNFITVRDPNTGTVTIYKVVDTQMLKDVNKGDSVELFSKTKM